MCVLDCIVLCILSVQILQSMDKILEKTKKSSCVLGEYSPWAYGNEPLVLWVLVGLWVLGVIFVYGKSFNFLLVYLLGFLLFVPNTRV